ncbi:acyltransferase family protein [Clostridium sp.]|uniref:acyltransferase family protein n=1 Tax=Clostridium sp. TaxID=1506 RepID=UPI003D6D0D96
MNNILKRNNRIDFLKGLIILLVVWGHTIQFANNGEFDFFLNPIFIFIYTFHMPLFVFIGGYLFLYSVSNKRCSKVIINKIKQLVVPIVCWSTTYYLLTHLLTGNSISIVNLINRYISSFWFLFTLFVITLIVVFVHKYFMDNVFIYAIMAILILSLPEGFNLVYVKFMYPYFVLGYLLNKHKIKLRKYNDFIGISCIILFVVLLTGWTKPYYIYTTGMSLYVDNIFNKLFIICYRYLSGLTGSVFFIYITYKTYKENANKNIINIIGKYTLGIYIIQTYIMILLARVTIPNFLVNNFFIYNFIFTPVLTTLIIGFCIGVSLFIKKNKYLNAMFLGGRLARI